MSTNKKLLNSKAVSFIDETEQFLSELDGVEADNDGVLCLAATNTPWHLD